MPRLPPVTMAARVSFFFAHSASFHAVSTASSCSGVSTAVQTTPGRVFFHKTAQGVAGADFQNVVHTQLTQAAQGIFHVDAALHLLYQQLRDAVGLGLFHVPDS